LYKKLSVGFEFFLDGLALNRAQFSCNNGNKASF